MGLFKNLMAGLAGAIALNVLHETVRKTNNNVPRLNLLGQEALNKTLEKYGTPIADEAELYRNTLIADVVGNTIYYSFIGGKPALIWPKAVFLGLSAGTAALKLPEKIGLDPSPVTFSKQTKALTMAYYLFGALVTAYILQTSTKK